MTTKATVGRPVRKWLGQLWECNPIQEAFPTFPDEPMLWHERDWIHSLTTCSLVYHTRLAPHTPRQLPSSIEMESGNIHVSFLAEVISRRITLFDTDYIPDDVAQLLGSVGVTVLKRTLRLLKAAALERQWPLETVDVQVESDPELDDSKYVLVVLKLRTSFDMADRILRSFYPIAQEFADNLSANSRAALTDRIYFDVGTV